MGTNIILIGFMGTGKTTVGKLLAKTLQYPFIDLDEKIETDNGMTIPKIFEERGESYFRAREKDAVREKSTRVPCHLNGRRHAGGCRECRYAARSGICRLTSCRY